MPEGFGKSAPLPFLHSPLQIYKMHEQEKKRQYATRYNTGEIIVMDQVQKYMDGPRLLRMRLGEYTPQLSTRNVDLVP